MTRLPLAPLLLLCGLSMLCSASAQMMYQAGAAAVAAAAPSTDCPRSGPSNELVSPWKLMQTYPPIAVCKGSNITFEWDVKPPNPPHGMFVIPSATCPAPGTFVNNPGQGLIQITQPVPKGTVQVFVPLPGTYYIACPFGPHCTTGPMLQKIIAY